MKTPAPARMSGSGLPLWLAVGHFILRAPARLARIELPVFLARIAGQPARRLRLFTRVECLARRWLRLPVMRSRDTCYLRSLVLFRFVDASGGDLCLHFGVDEPRGAGERLHGHAWVSLDGQALNPPGTLGEGRLKEIYRFSTLTGGSSTSGATFAAAMLRRGDAAPCDRTTAAGVISSRTIRRGQRNSSRASNCAQAGSSRNAPSNPRRSPETSRRLFLPRIPATMFINRPGPAAHHLRDVAQMLHFLETMTGRAMHRRNDQQSRRRGT